MSGFLQRLASGVLHAQPAIHPAVGTIWSTAGMNGPGMKEPLATQRGAPVSESALHKHAEQPAIVEAVTFQPLVAPQRRVVSALPPAPQTKANPQQSEALPPPRHQATSPEHTGPRPLHPIETARPLVPAPLPVPAPAGARKAPSLLPLSQRQAQPAPSLAEEPDSIEIHIGRIEVLAAAPRPAQPAAPRPARKSLDLAEYLRGERRSR